MTTKKAVQANYSAELIAVIVAEYNALIVEHNKDNKIVLDLLSKKHSKSVASIRAKLASLKVYHSADKTDKPSSVPSKVTKEQIANSIAKIVGCPLDGLEVAPKSVLLAIADKLLAQNDKINDLIADLTSENEPAICDDLNDND